MTRRQVGREGDHLGGVGRAVPDGRRRRVDKAPRRPNRSRVVVAVDPVRDLGWPAEGAEIERQAIPNRRDQRPRRDLDGVQVDAQAAPAGRPVLPRLPGAAPSSQDDGRRCWLPLREGSGEPCQVIAGEGDEGESGEDQRANPETMRHGLFLAGCERSAQVDHWAATGHTCTGSVTRDLRGRRGRRHRPRVGRGKASVRLAAERAPVGRAGTRPALPAGVEMIGARNITENCSR